jgi:hypothetical protein
MHLNWLFFNLLIISLVADFYVYISNLYATFNTGISVQWNGQCFTVKRQMFPWIVQRSFSVQLCILHFGVTVEAEDELDHVDDEGRRVDGAIEKRQRPKTETLNPKSPKCRSRKIAKKEKSCPHSWKNDRFEIQKSTF